MLHGDFVRSPQRMRVKSINSEEALKVPGVLAVITAETLKTVNSPGCRRWPATCRWCRPTARCCSRPGKGVRGRHRPLCRRDDGINKVVVEYEPLPALIDPFRALDADAPVLREDLAGRRQARTVRASTNHVFEDGGRRDPERRGLCKAEVTIKEMIPITAPIRPAGDLPVRVLVRQDQGRADDLALSRRRM
jgi:carbon-monoxide dehydrogenase large subunit